jgi:hypothetical protein
MLRHGSAGRVAQVNSAIDVGGSARSYICILDIFGFENFDVNGFERLAALARADSHAHEHTRAPTHTRTRARAHTRRFEQLCINYANEKLHQQFIHKMFKFEAEMYAAENINIAAVDFIDKCADRPPHVLARAGISACVCSRVRACMCAGMRVRACVRVCVV